MADRYAVLERVYALMEQGAVSEDEVLAAALTVVCDLGSLLHSRDELSARVEALLDEIEHSDKAHLRLVAG
jgi:hypothetical protein